MLLWHWCDVCATSTDFETLCDAGQREFVLNEMIINDLNKAYDRYVREALGV